MKRTFTGGIDRVAVLGLGKAGGSLVASLQAAGIDVVGAARRIPGLLRTPFASAQLLVLAVPDDAIDDVARELRKRSTALPPLVVHLSGARDLEPLTPLSTSSKQATRVGAFHPLAALDGVLPIPQRTLVAIDARAVADRRRLADLAHRLGLAPARVPAEARARYHAGAVVAANLSVALLHEGMRLLKDAGVPPALSRLALARLLVSTAEAALRSPLPAALTGPVARGDVKTLERHVEVLRDEPELLAVYQRLSRVLIDDVAVLGPLQRRRLRAALQPSPARTSKK